MDPVVNDWMQLLLRWAHVVAGVLWIGHLYFFNFVNAQVVKTYDAESKKKVVPELMPRALFWFRWGAAYTWLTGFLLLGLVFYMNRLLLLREDTTLGVGAVTGLGLGALVVGFAVYDAVWKSPLGKNEPLAATVCFLLLLALTAGLDQVMGERAVVIHVGALFGTVMAANVWMRIWPAQRKIIAGIQGAAPEPEPTVAATAALRSKHNTFLSVPLLLMMLDAHALSLFGMGHTWLAVGGAVGVGFGVVKFLYAKSASPAATQY